jgi:PAS domain S-box-containing protein
MRFFQNMSIGRKQMLIIMLTSTVALLLACVIFVLYDVASVRKGMVKQVSVLAEAIGNNCSATIEFNDPKTAEETLSALRAEPSVVSACVYTRSGEKFAVYKRSGAAPFVFPGQQAEGYEFNGGFLYLFHPIVQRDQTVGTIFVATDLTDLNERLAHYPIILGQMLAAALFVAFILSTRLHRVVSAPIQRLAEVARAVASDKNYSVRAIKQNDDELGRLIDVFNEMLGQIQQRDEALQTARNNLEQRVVERTEELRQSRALYHSLVEHLPVHIYRKDKEGRFLFVNSHFCDFQNMTPEQIIGKTVFQLSITDELAELSNEEDQMILRYGQPLEREEAHQDPTKRARHLQVIKSPVFNSDHQVIGTQGIALDITARKEAEAKLEEAHRELIAISRQAGMAEVATSVLHNVGNVLTSVNIGIGLLSERLKKSKVANIKLATAMITANEANLGEFLTRDPKGRQLPGYLEELADFVSNEHADLLKESETLRKHIEHINDIVAMQQSYAKVSGVTEIVKVADLVDDAVRMNAGALSRHDVELVRDFEAHIPQITVDKHKVLQILVNLIRNAKYAYDEVETDKKRLIIRVTNGDDRVRIKVIDQGVGIPAENLTRIFNHGFTTRKNGHGFGLHSGAIAAKEMGGALTAHSDGPGKGATFTLELPLQPERHTS